MLFQSDYDRCLAVVSAAATAGAAVGAQCAGSVCGPGQRNHVLGPHNANPGIGPGLVPGLVRDWFKVRPGTPKGFPKSSNIEF